MGHRDQSVASLSRTVEMAHWDARLSVHWSVKLFVKQDSGSNGYGLLVNENEGEV